MTNLKMVHNHILVVLLLMILISAMDCLINCPKMDRMSMMMITTVKMMTIITNLATHTPNNPTSPTHYPTHHSPRLVPNAINLLIARTLYLHWNHQHRTPVNQSAQQPPPPQPSSPPPTTPTIPTTQQPIPTPHPLTQSIPPKLIYWQLRHRHIVMGNC